MKRWRKFCIWSLASVIAFTALCCAIGVIALDGALHPGRRILTREEEALALFVAARNHAEFSDITIKAADGVELRAWNFRPRNAYEITVILLHGQADNRVGMLGNADMLLRNGYAVVLPDARAHGLSGGDLATYGLKESRDLRSWYDWIQQSRTSECIDGLGDSMGAAQLLQSLTSVPGFCAVIAESPFSSFRQASYDRIGQEFGQGPWLGRTVFRPAVEMGFLYAQLKYSLDLSQVSPESSVCATNVPVLLIHGRSDTNLPPRHSESIVAHCSSHRPALELWEPIHAGHCGAAQAEPFEYEHRVVDWFKNHAVRN